MRLTKQISGEEFLFRVSVKPGVIKVRPYMTDNEVEADLVGDYLVPREPIYVVPAFGKKAHQRVQVDKIKINRQFRSLHDDMNS